MAYVARRYAGWFDGVDDKVVIPYSDSLSFEDKFTIIAVSRPTALTGTYQFIFDLQWGEPVGYLGFRESNGVLYNRAIIKNESSDSAVLDGRVIELGKVHITGLRYDGNIVQLLYGSSVEMSDSLEPPLKSSVLDLAIGSQAKGSYPFYGDIYCVMVWNRALTDDEIAKINEDPFDPNNIPKDGLVGWWDFNKADWSNGILPDLSGNGNDGQINGVVQRDVLVKRGTGELPQYDLLWSWVCDGIDDYCIVDFNNWAVTKALSFAVWNNVYGGKYWGVWVKDYAKGIGHYDSTEDAWRVDAGEEGYFMDLEYPYDETMLGREFLASIYNVKVDDNSQSVPIFRLEIVNGITNEVIFSHDYMANEFPTDSYSSWKSLNCGVLPYSKYKLRLYSYGNVGFWIRKAEIHGWRSSVVSCGDFFSRRYYGYVNFRLYKTDGSYKEINCGDYNIRDWENYVVSWSNLDQKMAIYINGESVVEVDDTTGLDMRGNATQLTIGKDSSETFRFVGEIASIMLFDRLLNDTEVSDLYSRKFVLDGLVHWWVVDENGNLVDLVTGNSYEIQGNPYIRRIYDDDGRLNSGTGVVVFDIIKDNRGV